MKADERHKMRTNQFATFLQDFPEKLKKNSRLLTWSAAVVVVAVAAVLFLQYRAGARQDQAWNEFTNAVNSLSSVSGTSDSQTRLAPVAERFALAADAYPDSPPVTAWNYYYQGVTLMTEATLRGKVGGSARYNDLLGKAEEAFKKVLEQPYDPMATPAARIALGNIALDRGQFDAARAGYTEVADDDKAGGAMRELALRRRGLLPAAPEVIVFVPAGPDASTSAVAPIPSFDTDEDETGRPGPFPGPVEQVVPVPAPPPPPAQVPNTGEPGPRTGPGPTTQPHAEGDE